MNEYLTQISVFDENTIKKSYFIEVTKPSDHAWKQNGIITAVNQTVITYVDSYGHSQSVSIGQVTNGDKTIKVSKEIQLNSKFGYLFDWVDIDTQLNGWCNMKIKLASLRKKYNFDCIFIDDQQFLKVDPVVGILPFVHKVIADVTIEEIPERELSLITTHDYNQPYDAVVVNGVKFINPELESNK